MNQNMDGKHYLTELDQLRAEQRARLSELQAEMKLTRQRIKSTREALRQESKERERQLERDLWVNSPVEYLFRDSRNRERNQLIYRLRSQGVLYRQIASEVGVSAGRCRQIVERAKRRARWAQRHITERDTPLIEAGAMRILYA